MPYLDLLTANDRLGEYPDSYYTASATPQRRPQLSRDVDADVCIVGAGLTGLSAALRLAQAGKSVVVLEASRISFGASGRNGGQIGTGQRSGPAEIEQLVGLEKAKSLFDIGVKAHDLVVSLCRLHHIDIGYQSGIAGACFSDRDMKQAHTEAARLRDIYGYEQLDCLDAAAMRAQVCSPCYQGGTIDRGAGHGDPFALALGLAKAAEAAGAIIYEQSRLLSIDPLQTAEGSVRADHVILACNGYLGRLDTETARHVMPINNFIVATEPLGEQQACELIPENIAVCDSKFVVNYFRRSPDHRLLFGGGESYGYKFPRNLEHKARRPMQEIFPQLTDVKIEYAWGGTLAITRNRLPYVRRRGKLWISCGYSGHGVGLGTFCGDMTARAILGDDADFALMSAIPHRPFPGGEIMRQPLLVSAMLWYRMHDLIRSRVLPHLGRVIN